jgi:RHS Repeat
VCGDQGANPIGKPLIVGDGEPLLLGSHRRRSCCRKEVEKFLDGLSVAGDFDLAGLLFLGQVLPVPHQPGQGARVGDYDAATGLPGSTSAVIDGTNRSISRSYDEFGRPTSYTDADHSTTQTSYDVLDRPHTVSDDRGTQTLNYDGQTGDLTSLSVSDVGSFTGTYDSNARPVSETLPNGLQAATAYDPTGAGVALSYRQTEGCSGCVDLFDDSVIDSIHGQWREQDSNLGQDTYEYDAAGRLTQVTDIAGGQCTQRQYGYDTTWRSH